MTSIQLIEELILTIAEYGTDNRAGRTHTES